jgi:hypothetical protein
MNPAAFDHLTLEQLRPLATQWVGAYGVQLQPLVDALRDWLLQQNVILADETPLQMLAPGAKKTQRTYVRAYAPSPFDDLKAVVYDFGRVEPVSTRAASWATGKANWSSTISEALLQALSAEK